MMRITHLLLDPRFFVVVHRPDLDAFVVRISGRVGHGEVRVAVVVALHALQDLLGDQVAAVAVVMVIQVGGEVGDHLALVVVVLEDERRLRLELAVALPLESELQERVAAGESP